MEFQLLYLPASPFSRKVRVVSHEVGISEKIQLVPVDGALSPVNSDSHLNETNPLGKVPALILADGSVIYDSRVICEYLDSIHAGPRIIPIEGLGRWRSLTQQALADGILDASVLVRYETVLRPQQQRWDAWESGQRQKCRRALDMLERSADSLIRQVDIGGIAVGCALAYLDFRLPEEGWRRGRPRLHAWFDEFAERQSMLATRPG